MVGRGDLLAAISIAAGHRNDFFFFFCHASARFYWKAFAAIVVYGCGVLPRAPCFWSVCVELVPGEGFVLLEVFNIPVV